MNEAFTLTTKQSGSPGAAGDTTDASKPFDSSAKADIILRTSDSAHFYVLKSLLSLVSPVFDAMLSLCQGETVEKDAILNEIPVVQIDEDSTTLYNLLLLIYPYSQRPPSTVDICFKMANAAQKYGMDDADRKIRELVTASDAMGKEPLRVFAIAIYLGWEDVMRAAAFSTLAVPLRELGWWEELRLVNAGEFQKLLQWRFTCQDAADKLLDGGMGGDTGAETIRELLKVTGCPRGVVGNDKNIIAKLLRQNQKTPSSTIYKSFESMTKNIDKALSAVPLDVGCHGGASGSLAGAHKMGLTGTT
ncbi:hypothetical protein AX15_000571 [Amanita polypyramis BW_CC]|nr:hypothetical protein AX15_000571 [Amanita polypyramis BW_CC]